MEQSALTQVALLPALGVAIANGCMSPEDEAEGLKIRAAGQAKAQETIAKTLTQDYLRFKLYDSPNAKMVLLPEKLNVPILINPGFDQSRTLQQEGVGRGEEMLPGR